MVGLIKIGVIGISEGNGHPFSFSAIINGFDNEAMKDSGWDVIYNYLIQRHSSEFGFDNIVVTHAWTQDPAQTQKLAKACRIPYAVENAEDMLEAVDAVIIARDDYKSHLRYSKAFLESGKFVFIDKPLSLDLVELRYFRKYLENGRLMSCAGARYARELDEIRSDYKNFGQIKLVRGTVINSMEKYGIHMLDGIFSVTGFNVKTVSCIQAQHTSMVLRNWDNSLTTIDALGSSEKTLQFDFWSDRKRFHAETNDNFTMFRRLLADFVKMMRTETPAIEPDLVIDTMKVLVAATLSIKESREVGIDEIAI